MNLDYLAFLALIQGVTEFIPVSSSGHLVLAHEAIRATPAEASISIDVALHLGTLMAVLTYFRHDAKNLLFGLLDMVRRRPSGAAQQARHMVWATLPVLLAAAVLLGLDLIETLRQPHIVAWASILFAVPLYLADRYGADNKTERAMDDKTAFQLGCAQMLALIPGASRAGVTIMAGRQLGFTREAAARYSMLMAMPVIVCFALLGLIDMIANAQWHALGQAAFGAVLAALFAFITIDVFLRLTRVMSLWPFVVYRIALGLAILAVL